LPARQVDGQAQIPLEQDLAPLMQLRTNGIERFLAQRATET
jgi:hypothetical protein